jgi:hypothetical protein
MRTLRTLMIVSACVLAGPALATDLATCPITPEEQAQLSCLCVAPIASPVAYLDQVKGEVWKTEKADFTPIASSPASLHIGDKVMFSADGEGLLTAGACRQAIGPKSTLVVYQLDSGCACAALVEDPKPVAKHHGALLVGAAAIIGAKVLIHSISP